MVRIYKNRKKRKISKKKIEKKRKKREPEANNIILELNSLK